MATTKKPTPKKAAKKKPAAKSNISGETIFESHSKLQSHVSTMEDDVRKFADEGVASAGRRVRKGLQEIRKLCSQFRKDVTELTKANKAEKE